MSARPALLGIGLAIALFSRTVVAAPVLNFAFPHAPGQLIVKFKPAAAAARSSTRWSELDRFGGRQSWKAKVYTLSSKLAGAKTLQLRFRATTDYSNNAGGWRFDQVVLYSPAAID